MSAKYSEFGRLLTDARVSAGIPRQSALGDLLGVKQQTVSRWEAGESRPKSGQVVAVAEALGVDVQELMIAAGYASVGPVVVFDRPFPLAEIPPESFERFSAMLVEYLYRGASVQGYGSTGHKQHGLDILAIMPDRRRFTFQCKREKYFGPAKVKAAVAEHTAEADKKVILLSRLATPDAREEIAKFAGWELWDQEDISRKIRGLAVEEQKRIVRTFFRPYEMALLGESAQSPWESFDEFFDAFEDVTLLFNHRWELVGRAGELAMLGENLRNTKLPAVFVVGSGGSGKSRLIKHALTEYSAANPEISVRFLSRDADLDRASLAELGGGRLLLVVDDAHDRTDLHALFEFTSVNRERVRLVIATRPYGLERHRRQALRFSLVEPSSTSVELQELTREDAKELSLQVFATLGHSHMDDVAEQIARLTYDCPLATVLATQIIANEPRQVALIGHEERFRAAIFNQFEKVAAGHIGEPDDAKPLGKMLRFISLVQPVGLEDERTWAAYANFANLQVHEVNRLLGLLGKAGVLFKRGRTYRLSPDVLADYLVEDQCVGVDGKSTGYAEAVMDFVDETLMANLLVNLARLDWRRKQGQTGESRLLDGVWAKVNPGDDKWDSQYNAISEVAFYQPKRCLDFVERRLAEGRQHHKLARICKFAAYNIDDLPRAVELLWELGKNDDRLLNQEPDHAIRILKELAEVEPKKPLEYNEGVVDFGLSIAERADAWSFKSTPLDFLEGILATEGHQTESDARQIFMHPFFVNPESVKPLREKVVDLILRLLSNPNPAVAVVAAKSLHNAIRFPMGLLGAAPPEGNREKWTEQFSDILQRVLKIVQENDLNPAVQVEIGSSVGWLAGHGPDPLSEMARSIIAAFADTLEARTDRALVDGYGTHARVSGQIDSDTDWAEILSKLVSDIETAFPDGDSLAAYIESRLDELARAGKQDPSSAYVLVDKLLMANQGLCKALVSRVKSNPRSLLQRYAPVALGYIFAADADLYRTLTTEFAAAGDEDAISVAAHAIGNRSYEPGTTTQGDLDLIMRLAAYEVEWIAITALRALRRVAASAPETAKSMVMELAIRSERMADDLATLFTFQSEIPLSLFTDAELVQLLGKFELLPELDGHWVQQLMTAFSKRIPRETMQFFLRRIEAAGPREDDTTFRPINYGPWLHSRMGFRQTPIARDLMREFLHWWKNAPDGWLTQYHARNAFEAMFAPYDDELVAFVEEVAESAQQDDFTYIAFILREADTPFVFRYPDFLERLFEKAQQYGPKTFRMVSTEVYCSAISGSKSGAAGEAFPEDVALKEAAQKALEKCPRFSKLRGLYEDLVKHADHEIQRAHEDYGSEE